MRAVAIIIMIAGTALAGFGLVLLTAGWFGLVPYALGAGGALLLVGSLLGAVTHLR
ncbi:MAG: hypothetical protein ABIQ30_14990 [Devosia sp.]